MNKSDNLTLNEYQAAALRTKPQEDTDRELLANFALGLVCEAGELGDLIKKNVFHKHVLQRDDAIKELGDVLWYAANLAGLLDTTLDEVAKANISKLKQRYPEGFSSRDSVARVDETKFTERSYMKALDAEYPK